MVRKRIPNFKWTVTKAKFNYVSTKTVTKI